MLICFYFLCKTDLSISKSHDHQRQSSRHVRKESHQTKRYTNGHGRYGQESGNHSYKRSRTTRADTYW